MVTVDGQTAAGAMGARVLNFTFIPVIDIAPLFGDDRAALEATSREIGDACRDIGFFDIGNHGMAPDLIDRIYAHSRTCHAAQAGAVGRPQDQLPDTFGKPLRAPRRHEFHDDTPAA